MNMMRWGCSIILVVLLAGESMTKTIPRDSQLQLLTNSVSVQSVGDKEVCQFCEGAFRHFKAVFETYRSQLKTALLNFCKITGGFSTECTDLVTNYYDKAYDYFVKNFDSKKFCTLITLCPGVSSLGSNVNGEMCSICKEAENVLLIELKVPSVKSAIKAKVLDSCKNLGQFSSICQHYVSQEFDQAYQFFLNLLEKNNICEEIGVCPETENKKATVFTGETCTICEQVIGTLKVTLESATAKAYARSAIESLCTEARSLASECKVVVDLLFDKGYNYLLQVLNPYTLCADLHLCKPSPTTIKKKQVDLSSETCTMCEEVIGTLKVTLQSPATKAYVKSAVESVCNETGSLAPECKIAIELVFDKAYDYLLKALNPYTLCEELKMCKPSEIPKSKQNQVDLGDETCTLCEQVIGTLKVTLQSATAKAYVKSTVESLCTEAGSLSSECKIAIDLIFDKAYSYLIEALNPYTLCEELKLCKPSQAAPEKSTREDQYSSSNLCLFCVEGVDVVKKFLNSTEIRTELKGKVEDLCSEIPTYSSECKNYVNQYFDIIYDEILNELNDDEVCSLVGACAETPAEKKFIEEQVCEICLVGAEALKAELADKDVEKDIKTEITALCSDLGSFSATCNKYVTEYFDFAYAIALAYLKPQTVCGDLKLCNDSSQVEQIQDGSGVNASQSTTCSICEFAVTQVRNELSTNETEQMIKEELGKVCDLLGSSAGICHSYVNSYFNYVYQLALSYLQSQAVCTDLHLCSTNSSNSVSLKNKLQDGFKEGEYCEICEAGVKEIKTEISTSSFRTDVKTEVLKLCNDIGSTSCQQVVSTYFDSVYTLLLTYLTPKTVCSEMGLCKKDVVRLTSSACDICKTVTTLFASEIKALELKGKNAVYIEMLDLCKKLPSDINDQCSDFISIYGPPVLQMTINEYGNPSDICTELTIC